MKFKSTNELYNFDFQDAYITKCKFGDEGITLCLEALIIEPENSQNENYTKSYADSAELRLVSGKIISGLKDGYKKYDVNDKVIENVADESLSVEDLKDILRNSEGAYLYAMDICEDSEENNFKYTICIEFPNKEQYDTSVTESYQIKVEFNKSLVEWERYLNKVQA